MEEGNIAGLRWFRTNVTPEVEFNRRSWLRLSGPPMSVKGFPFRALFMYNMRRLMTRPLTGITLSQQLCSDWTLWKLSTQLKSNFRVTQESIHVLSASSTFTPVLPQNQRTLSPSGIQQIKLTKETPSKSSRSDLPS